MAGKGQVKNLFLIGYRGTGKSSTAIELAKLLHWTPVDADALLEERAGTTIRTIFAKEKETGFRNREAAILNELCQREQQVIATGGGVILRQENRVLICQNGKAIWLQAAPETLWQRISKDSTTEDRRPNLAMGGLKEIEELLRQREPLYAATADWNLTTDTLTPNQVAQKIFEHYFSER